jgi:uncharacterized membrane protein
MLLKYIQMCHKNQTKRHSMILKYIQMCHKNQTKDITKSY